MAIRTSTGSAERKSATAARPQQLDNRCKEPAGRSSRRPAKEARDSDSEAVDLSDEEDEAQTATQSTVKKAKRLTVQEIRDLDAQGELPSSGLLGMKFMQEAIKQKREDAKKEALDVLKFLALLLVLQAAGGHVGLSLAVSPCARLLQQVGDDLHSLLVGLLHSLSSSNLRLRDLHYDLIHLNTYQLAQEFQVLTESSQHLLGCGCGSCRPGLTLEEAHLKVQRRNAQLSQRLKKLWQLIQPETELHLTFAFEEVDFRLRATADESSQVLFLLKASDLLHGHLEQLKKTLEVILQQAPSLLRKPGATERSKLLELLENPPLHLIGTPSGRMKLLRSHVLCNAEEPPDSAWTPWTPWMDASSATWHGMSSLSWLQRLKRPSKRVCSVLPFGMPGANQRMFLGMI
ncbi:unnamed protein product [Cladocopium goreaui]|uniref:Uncharacterized protein n=1 Tax=Cladocopium goreaui TaxID=2562237 RepID=A0A9P1BJM8_9DINO|nr:unnamed protein product [Cladocopium goreaui]